MRIAVCIKQVPDPQAPEGSFYVDESTNEPRWSPPADSLISTFDLHAVEAAVQLKEQHKGEVIVLSLGAPEVERGLRRALAAGADEAVRLDPDLAPDGDRMAVAAALAGAVRKLGDIDLVLCGRIAADWDMGHVPLMMSEFLDVPSVSPVIGIQAADSSTLRIERLSDEGHDVIDIDLPCVLAVSNELNEPRYPTMRATLDAQRKTVLAWDSADIEPHEAQARARLSRLRARDLTRACEIIEGSSQEDAGRALADLFRAKGFVSTGGGSN